MAPKGQFVESVVEDEELLVPEAPAPPEEDEEAAALAAEEEAFLASSPAKPTAPVHEIKEDITTSFGSDSVLALEFPSAWTLEKYQKEVKVVLEEFLKSSEASEAVRCFQELLTACPFPDELAIVCVRSSLERGVDAQTAVVSLLCKMQAAGTIDGSALVRCFEKLVCSWEDIQIDSPQAPQQLIAMAYNCVTKGAIDELFLQKLSEPLLSAGLEKCPPEVADGLKGMDEDIRNFKKLIATCLDEFWVSRSNHEVGENLKGFKMPAYHHEFVKKAITMSFSQSGSGDGAKDSANKAMDDMIGLFEYLFGKGVLTGDDFQWGVTRLLGQLDDIALDCPTCVELATEVCCGLISAELISAPFVRRCRLLRFGGPTGLQVLDKTQRKTPEYSKRQLDPAHFKREIATMIAEYFNSISTAEFCRCVRELGPMTAEQSAEVVRKVMFHSMERSGKECEQALALLVCLVNQEELERSAIQEGFEEMYVRMPDIVLDVPDARDMAKSFVVQAKQAKLLTESWAIPSE